MLHVGQRYDELHKVVQALVSSLNFEHEDHNQISMISSTIDTFGHKVCQQMFCGQDHVALQHNSKGIAAEFQVNNCPSK